MSLRPLIRLTARPTAAPELNAHVELADGRRGVVVMKAWIGREMTCLGFGVRCDDGSRVKFGDVDWPLADVAG